MNENKKKQRKNSSERIRLFIYRMVSVNVVGEKTNQIYDVISTSALILNLIVTFMGTFANLSKRFFGAFSLIESVTVFFFLMDYILRVLTAKYLYPRMSEPKAILTYAVSFTGIIDLISFLPYYLPVFFPAGTAVFKIFRVARILRLFRINSHYDSLNVITEVLSSKKQQLISSVFIIITLMMASSLCMYSVEHDAQPDVFRNAFSGIWWSASTLLTVGYGDIYPVTPMGKLLGIFISFLGVGMVAIPTGIISAGFVEQYSHVKKTGELLSNEDIRFVKIALRATDPWAGRAIKDLGLPSDLNITMVKRDQEILIPRGDLILQKKDEVVIGAQTVKGDKAPLNMREIVLSKDHPWTGNKIRDLDISRQTYIMMIKRNGKTLLPGGDLVLAQSDRIYVYSRKNTVMAAEDFV